MKKIRVMPRKSSDNWNRGFEVQEKKWWGWKTIYCSNIPRYIDEYLEDLKKFCDYKFIR
jgi:hypothetical protein